MCSIKYSLLGATVAWAFPGLSSFHSYLRMSPFGASCSSELCAALSVPSSVLNCEVITLPLALCSIEKVSVAIRWPFVNTPSEPESTACPGASFLSPAHASDTMASTPAIPQRTIFIDSKRKTPPKRLWSGPGQGTCNLFYDVLDRTATSFHAHAGTKVIGSPLLVQLLELTALAKQRPIHALRAAALPEFVDWGVEKDRDISRLFEQMHDFRLGESSASKSGDGRRSKANLLQ